MIESVAPCVEGGRLPVKRVVGEPLEVSADVFADGHDALAAVLRWRREDGEGGWSEVPLAALGNDRWRGTVTLDGVGRYRYAVRAWVDAFRTWRRDLEKRLDAGQDVALELRVGAELVRRAAAGARGDDARLLERAAGALVDAGRAVAERARDALDADLADAMARAAPREHATETAELPLWVEPLRARFSAWYEMFPRSAAREPGRHGTLSDVRERLDYVAGMGFDVLYLPPIHPIGETLRKGPNNSTESRAGDVGSPWAIGGRGGGHEAVHADLGTLEDLRELVSAAREKGLEVALDVAFQCSPDHPWTRSHREWFRVRPDGTIQYAENPPKKYQDIYPFDFESEDWRGLWEALAGVFEFWMEQGVRVFRVDNPHTKSLRFWEWCIDRIKRRDPGVILLSEAFTRPRVLHRLAKVGFTQSYTYFPWRTTKRELTEYGRALARPEVRDYLRPNHWPNTPDILTEGLQTGGRAGFQLRLLLAATLGASYGIYGPAFELCEGRPVREGSEEYLDSEKYQLRAWNLEDPASLRPLIARVNRVRRQNPALQTDAGLTFHETDSDELLCYSKRADDNVVLVVANLDPHHVQSGWLTLDLERLGVDERSAFQVHDLVSDARYLWNGPRCFVQIDPAAVPAHVFRVQHRVRSERDFDYYF